HSHRSRALAPGSGRSYRRRTSGRCPLAGSTASTTACSCAPTCTRSSTGGYLGVDPKHRLLVSPRLRGEFGNGEEFYARAGEHIAVPERPGERPHREFLEWPLEGAVTAAGRPAR